MEHFDATIIGAGQAGLALSHGLAAAGIEHVVLERGRIGQSWRDRWDSFCLVTPNWSVRLPGFTYAGPDPDGFMRRDEVVGMLVEYAGSFGSPVREDVKIESVGPFAKTRRSSPEESPPPSRGKSFEFLKRVRPGLKGTRCSRPCDRGTGTGADNP